MNVSIIKATTDHVNDICRICSEGWRQTVQDAYSEEYQKKNVEYWYNPKKIHEDIIKGSYTHVAIVNQEVVGTIGGTMTSPSVSEIYVFYVDQAYRYKGIGSKLLDTFTWEHIKNSATKQYVSVEEGNELGIPFYQSHGFKQNNVSKRYWRPLNQ